MLPILDVPDPLRSMLAFCIAQELETANAFYKNNSIG
jgi:hypothetical protein